jgi:CheY-like chemotaxis protein
MTTGKLPFIGNPAEIGLKHVQEEPPRIRDLVPDLPESIDVAVTRMLAKDPDQRYGSVDEVLEVLAEIRSTPIGRTVLLAEGNEDLRALIEHHLAAQGLMVEVADDGEQAVELLLREKPDMVVLDIEIPKIDGLRVTEILRRYRHLTEVPVYLLSRVRDEGYVAYAKQLNVNRLVKRPFAVRPFAREVRMTMGA